MIGRILTGVGALFGGALFSQFPEFYQQYLQRLGGRLDQAVQRTEEITADARQRGLTVPDYIQRFLDSEQHALEGGRMHESFATAERLREALEVLTQAEPWRRAAVFWEHYDGSVAESTYAIFTPALPLTLEGLAYASVGALASVALIVGGRKSARSLNRRRQHA